MAEFAAHTLTRMQSHNNNETTLSDGGLDRSGPKEALLGLGNLERSSRYDSGPGLSNTLGG